MPSLLRWNRTAEASVRGGVQSLFASRRIGSNDPSGLEQIDAVFVTIEPREVAKSLAGTGALRLSQERPQPPLPCTSFYQ